jgi:hypothetical protein
MKSIARDLETKSDRPTIWVSKLHKVYKTGTVEVHALKGISFEVNEGEFVSIETCIERLAYLSGTADWIDWQGIIHPLSWASITAYHAGGLEEVYTYPLDGFYEMWLIAGEHYFGLYHPGFVIKEVDYGLYVTWGVCSSINFLMNEKMDNAENIPEFTNSRPAIIMTVSFVILLIIIRLKLINTPIISHKQKSNWKRIN